ncbi:MAG: hypothetical protein Q9209_001610 [Squamulea sp. 1 TL-2023]
MPPLYLCVFLLASALFAATGGVLIAVVLISKSAMVTPTTENIAPNLLLAHAPLDGALFNAGLIFLTFIASIPGLVFTTQRTWLKVHSWMVLACIIVTLVIGLEIWYSTLKTRVNLAVMWDAHGPQIQNLLQERVTHLNNPYASINADIHRQWQCCGYMKTPFHTDSTCPDALAASAKPNCDGPFSNFANNFLDVVFTAMFGMVALDAILLLCGLVVLKKRAEEERYRHIDEKSKYIRI